MIYYTVSFSFKEGSDDEKELPKVKAFIGDLCQRMKAHGYRLMKNRNQPPQSRLSRYMVMIEFKDATQFSLPFGEVAQIGIHKGHHGAMIENVADFIVEIFEDAE